jgi:hypothetical protein
MKVGTVSIPTSTGDLSPLSATNPVAILLQGNYRTNASVTSSTDLRYGVGVGTYRGGSVQHGYAAQWSDDGNSTNTSGFSIDDDAIFRFLSAAGTVEGVVELKSMDGSGVTLTVSDAPATNGLLLSYVIFEAGDGWDDAYVTSYALSTAVATQDIALPSGFGNPDGFTTFFVVNMGGPATAQGTGSNDLGICLGMGTPTAQAISSLGDNTGSGNMVVRHIQRTSRIGQLWNTGVTGGDAEWHLDTTGHPTDGFQIAYDDQASIAAQQICLVLVGDTPVALSEESTRTTTGDQDIAAGFTPVGAILFGGNLPVSTSGDGSHADLGGQWLGATDFTNEVCQGWSDDDALAFNSTIMWRSATQTMEMRGPQNGTENGNVLFNAADASVNGTNLRLNYTTANGTARGFIAAIFGAAAAAQDFDLTPATETDSAVALSYNTKTLNIAGETDAAQALRVPKLTAATESDSAQALTFTKPIVKTLGVAAETDSAQAVTFTKTIFVTLGVASETDTAQALTVSGPQHVDLTTATETDSAQGLLYNVKTLTPASETDSAQALTVSGPKTLGQALELDAAQALSFTKTIFKTLGIATETDTATAQSAAKVKTLGVAAETDTAQALTKAKIVTLVFAAETDEARALALPITRTLAVALELEEAVALDVNAGEAIVVFFGPPSPSGGTIGGTPSGGRGQGHPSGAMFGPPTPSKG